VGSKSAKPAEAVEESTTTEALKPTVSQGTNTLAQAVGKTAEQHLTAINDAQTLDTCHAAILDHLKETGEGKLSLNLQLGEAGFLREPYALEDVTPIHQHLTALAQHGEGGGLNEAELTRYFGNLSAHLNDEDGIPLPAPLRAQYQLALLAAIKENPSVPQELAGEYGVLNAAIGQLENYLDRLQR
jgi:hypothetical protein